jgi:hypothetical protein
MKSKVSNIDELCKANDKRFDKLMDSLYELSNEALVYGDAGKLPEHVHDQILYDFRGARYEYIAADLNWSDNFDLETNLSIIEHLEESVKELKNLFKALDKFNYIPMFG